MCTEITEKGKKMVTRSVYLGWGIVVLVCLVSMLPHRIGRSNVERRDRRSFSIQATMLEFKSGQVHLQREDGRVIMVPLSKLSEADRATCERTTAATRPSQAAEATRASRQWRRHARASGNRHDGGECGGGRRVAALARAAQRRQVGRNRLAGQVGRPAGRSLAHRGALARATPASRSPAADLHDSVNVTADSS